MTTKQLAKRYKLAWNEFLEHYCIRNGVYQWAFQHTEDVRKLWREITDHFDEHKIIIQIRYNERYTLFTAYIVDYSLVGKGGFTTRAEIETLAIEYAFKIRNKQLK